MDKLKKDININKNENSKKKLTIGIASIVIVVIIIITMGYIFHNKELNNPEYYNGAYSFIVKDKYYAGLYATGYLELHNGKVNGKLVNSQGEEKSIDSKYTIDSGKVKISLLTGQYEGTIKGKNIIFDLKSGYNLVGCETNKKLELEYESKYMEKENLENILQENIKNGNQYINELEKNERNNYSNPYQLINEYDGTYKFYVEDTNNSGIPFFCSGYMKLENGEVEYKDTKSGYNRTEYGYFGQKDNNLYIKLYENTETLYQFNKNGEDKNLYCNLIEGYNFAGCDINKELILEYIDVANKYNDYITKNNFEKLEEEEKFKSSEFKKKIENEQLEEFKKTCETYSYEEMARNPEKIKDKNIKVTGQVIQSLKSSYGNDVTLRVNVTKKTYSYINEVTYIDTVYIKYTYPDSASDRILENDIVTIYGISTGETSYQSTYGGTITIPSIDAKVIEINK